MRTPFGRWVSMPRKRRPMDDPYALLGIAYFVLAFLFILLLYALERIAELERKVTRMQRAWAREAAFLGSLGDGDSPPPVEVDPPAILGYTRWRRR